MKSNFKRFKKNYGKMPGFILGSALLVLALVWVGCNNKVAPLSSYVPASSSLDRTTVANFDSGFGSVNINPNLYEVGTSGNTLKAPGAVTLVNNFTANVVSNGGFTTPGYNGIGYAYHVFATVTDNGDTTYPTIDLQAQMDSGLTYNASFFTGVKFYIRVATDDTAGKRVFEIPLSTTQAPPGGICDNSNNTCYDHFYAPYQSTNGVWKQLSFSFSSLQRQGFGSALTPPTLTGANLTRFLWLQWEEGNNNVKGVVTVDYSVDQIEFYQ